MPEPLDPRRVGDYFAERGTVERWWTPDTGDLAFHYDAEIQIVDDHLGIDPGWRVLDVGTGRGRFGLHLASRGCRVTGVDVNPEMLEIAKQSAKKRGVAELFTLEQHAAEDLEALPAHAYDLVMCMELFDHLPDLERALVSMRERLRPGGRLLFTFVPGSSLYGFGGNLYRRFKRRLDPESTFISRTYSLDEIRGALRSAGFEFERCFGVGLLCVNAQTRLFGGNPLLRVFDAVARVEANLFPYYTLPPFSRHAAHVVGFARARSEVDSRS